MMDLRKRAGGEHLYIRGVVDNDDYKIIFFRATSKRSSLAVCGTSWQTLHLTLLRPAQGKTVCHRLPLRPVPRRRLTGITSLSCTLLFPAAYVLIAVTAWWLR